MSDVALQSKPVGVLRRLADALRELGFGVAEGFAAARRFENLLTTSDAELARLGITRHDLPGHALFGTPRPR
jgi:hypothetical protein